MRSRVSRRGREKRFRIRGKREEGESEVMKVGHAILYCPKFTDRGDSQIQIRLCVSDFGVLRLA